MGAGGAAVKLRCFAPRFYWDPFPETLVTVDLSFTPEAKQPFDYVFRAYLGIWRLRFRFAVWRSLAS